MRSRKGGSVHSEKIREKCDQCSSFLTGALRWTDACYWGLLSGMVFPDLLLVRRVSERVRENGGRNSGKEGFVDRAVVGSDNGEEVMYELF